MEGSQGRVSSVESWLWKHMLSLGILQLSNAAGLTSILSRPWIMAVSNDRVALCLLFWMLIYRVNDSSLIEGWKCPMLRRLGDTSLTTEVKPQKPAGYEMIALEALLLCVYVFCMKGSVGWALACTSLAALDFTRGRHHWGTSKNILAPQEINLN